MSKMNEKIKNFYITIKEYGGYYFTIISIVGVLWGGFLAYDSWRDNNKLLQDNIKLIIEIQSRQRRADSLLISSQNNIILGLDNLSKLSEENNANVKSLRTSYIKYISNDKTLTKKDFLQYMDELSFDVKKSTWTRPPLQEIPVPSLFIK